MKAPERSERGLSTKPGNFTVSFDSAKKSITAYGVTNSPHYMHALLALATELSNAAGVVLIEIMEE